MVAWTPEAWTSAQVATASGMSTHQARTPRWTSTANPVRGISANSKGSRASPLV